MCVFVCTPTLLGIPPLSLSCWLPIAFAIDSSIFLPPLSCMVYVFVPYKQSMPWSNCGLFFLCYLLDSLKFHVAIPRVVMKKRWLFRFKIFVIVFNLSLFSKVFFLVIIVLFVFRLCAFSKEYVSVVLYFFDFSFLFFFRDSLH